jgi:hypothetical protein
MSLTKRAISKILATDYDKNKLYILECSKVTKSKGNFLSMMLSDGEDENKGIIEGREKVERLSKLKKNEKYKIMVHEFKTYNWYNKKIIEILDCSLID